jgi:hypothetical protein
MDMSEVLKLVFDRALAKLKAQPQQFEWQRKNKRKSEPIAYNPIYCEAVKQFYRILPHRTTDYYPEQLFDHLSPHRQQEEKEWLRKNYEPRTLPVWMDFMNTLKRGAAPANYAVIWPKNEGAEMEDEKSPEFYCENMIPLWISVDKWFNDQLFDVKLGDANGVVAVQPYKVKIVLDAENEPAVDVDQYRPIPVYYRSEEVIDFEEDEWYLLQSQEKSLVDYQGKKQPMGFVFYFFDRNTTTKIFQVGKYTDWSFKWVVEIEHNWKATPVWKLKGHPEIRENKMYFVSPFDYAVGDLNLAAKTQANKQMAEANSAWPHKIMYGSACDHRGDDGEICRNGFITVKDIDISCPKCGGSGYSDKPSPASTLVVNEQTATDNPNSPGLDRIKFASPEPGILTHLDKAVVDYMVEARDILHIYSTSDQATGSDTATGKQIDQNAMLAFIRPIVDELFDIYEDVLRAIVYQRYGDAAKEPSIVRPVDYDYRTSDDLLKQYTELLEKGAPPIALIKVLEKYIKTMFYEEAESKNVFKLILATDSVVAEKNSEVRSMVGARTLAPWQAVLHTSAFMFIDELVREDEKFFERTFEEQKQALIDKAKAAALELTPEPSELFSLERQPA